MANDVTLFTTGGAMALPEHLRGIEVDEQTKALAGGAGGLRISIKGGVFRMLNNGEEIARNDDRAMNVVIVRSSPDTARTYYEGEYVEGDSMPPTCWSNNGVTPDAGVKNKQSASCATCPQNVAGSGQNDSRACKFSRDLAVVLDGDMAGKVFKLKLPAMSIFGKVENGVMPLQAYGKLLVQHNLPVNSVVTELRFDTTAAVPKLGFKAVRYLTADEFETAKKQGETPDAIAATQTTVFQQDSGEPAPLALPGKSPVEDAQEVEVKPAVVQQPATTAAPAATPAKRTRAKPAAAAAAEPAPAPAPAPAAEPEGAHKMTTAAEFTYEEYIDAGWTDEALIENGLMEAPKKAAPPPAPPKKAAPKPPAAPKKDAEPVVVKQEAKNSGPAPQGTAELLAAWDSEEE